MNISEKLAASISTFILKIEAAATSEILFPSYNTEWCHTPENYSQNLHHCENFTSLIL
jgi:hypothetical protein